METSAPKNNSYRKAVLALIIANIIWGAAAPIFKYSLKNIPPFTLAFIRFYYASLILALFLLIRQSTNKNTESLGKQIYKIIKYDGKDLILLSLSGITFNISFFFLGLKISSAIDAPIIASAGPVFIFFLAIIYLKEKFNLGKFISMAISLLGVIIIIIQPLIEKKSDATVLGNVFFVFATMSAVASFIYGKKVYANHNFITVTFLTFVIGALTFIPFLIYEYYRLPDWILNLDHKGFIGITYGAILCSTVAYTLWGYGLSKIPASQVAIFSYIDPVIAVLIAIPLLGEKITLPYIIGSSFVLLGIYLAEKRIQYHPLATLFKNRFRGFIRL